MVKILIETVCLVAASACFSCQETVIVGIYRSELKSSKW
jgi:Mg2+/Co2+ transporter CorB